ncbi:MAG: sigma-70 family RNA polymerase sigma factor [Deltaproteobacteria bacterium]|nr:sigma-70 family RNA polymerase sigma factor [Deltaproteobacteria bacterium]
MSPELEERLRQLLAGGDLRATATEAIRGYGPQVLQVLRAMLRDEADAREAFSQFAENLWKGLSTFRGEASFKTWALRLACNAARNQRDEAWRRRGRRFATGEASAIAEEVRTRSVVRVELQRQALDRLRQALSVEEQSLLVLRLDQQLSWNEVADVLAEEGKPAEPAALMKRYERIKERLGKLAREQGLVD